jgi:hypothetical protein
MELRTDPSSQDDPGYIALEYIELHPSNSIPVANGVHGEECLLTVKVFGDVRATG